MTKAPLAWGAEDNVHMKTNPQVSRLPRMTAWAAIPLGLETRCMRHCGRREPGPERERLAMAYSVTPGGELERDVRLHWN